MTSARYVGILFKQVFQRDVLADFVPSWTRYSDMELSTAFIDVFTQHCVRFGKVRLPPKRSKHALREELGTICRHVSAVLRDSRSQFIETVKGVGDVARNGI